MEKKGRRNLKIPLDVNANYRCQTIKCCYTKTNVVLNKIQLTPVDSVLVILNLSFGSHIKLTVNKQCEWQNPGERPSLFVIGELIPT